MKLLLIALLTVLFLANCQSEKSNDKQELPRQATTIPETEKTLDVPWIAVFNDSTELLEIKRNPAARPGNLNEQDIIDALNLKYPEIRIGAVSRNEDTAIVEIKDANFLTEEMGSAGARAFLAEATYSLTEVEGIKAVDFRFKAGNHATPGLLSRASFENFN